MILQFPNKSVAHRHEWQDAGRDMASEAFFAVLEACPGERQEIAARYAEHIVADIAVVAPDVRAYLTGLLGVLFEQLPDSKR